MSPHNRFALSVCTNDYRYTIHKKRPNCLAKCCDCSYTVTDRILLNDLNISVKSGELLAILGPSGAGKTSLLNGLANRLHPRADLQGKVLFNGVPERKLVGKFSNYVLQKDHMLEWLTVEETLSYYSKWKLKTENKNTRKERVESVIAQLGLQSCRSSYIGGSFKGISGGEMKRVAIGMELLDDPALMFLDEPTSGLDAALAFDVLNLLGTLARNGRTIICTVHQPRSSSFMLFDRLLLMSAGSIAYLGPAKEAINYFASIGYSCPENFNPADFLLDLVSPMKKQSQDDVEIDFDDEKEGREASFISDTQLGRITISQDEIDQFPILFEKVNSHSKTKIE